MGWSFLPLTSPGARHRAVHIARRVWGHVPPLPWNKKKNICKILHSECFLDSKHCPKKMAVFSGKRLIFFFLATVFTSKLRHFQTQKYLTISQPHHLLGYRQLYIKTSHLWIKIYFFMLNKNKATYKYAITFCCLLLFEFSM